MNGAPAKPISGVAPSLGDQQPDRLGDVRDVGRLEVAQPVEVGRGTGSAATTGPTPGSMSRSTPTAPSGTTMSLKRIAASTPWRRTGCRVISVTRSGRRRLEHRDALADPAVLRQRPAGLAHEPDRGVRHRLAAAGPQEGAVLQGGSRGGAVVTGQPRNAVTLTRRR